MVSTQVARLHLRPEFYFEGLSQWYDPELHPCVSGFCCNHQEVGRRWTVSSSDDSWVSLLQSSPLSHCVAPRRSESSVNLPQWRDMELNADWPRPKPDAVHLLYNMKEKMFIFSVGKQFDCVWMKNQTKESKESLFTRDTKVRRLFTIKQLHAFPNKPGRVRTD